MAKYSHVEATDDCIPFTADFNDFCFFYWSDCQEKYTTIQDIKLGAKLI